MATIVNGWVKLCTTKNDYFGSYQGIDNYRLIDRYNQLKNIIDHKIDAKHASFLAQPVMNDDEISWYGEKFTETPIRLSQLEATEKQKYDDVKNDALTHYKEVIEKLKQDGSINSKLNVEYLEKAIKFVDDQFVYCYDNKCVLAVWGMRLKDKVIVSDGVIWHDYVQPKYCKITYCTNEHGKLVGRTSFRKLSGYTILAVDIPTVNAREGYEFVGWDVNPENYVVNEDMMFQTQYKEKEIITPPPVDPTPPTPPTPPITTTPNKTPWWKRFWNKLKLFFTGLIGSKFFKWLLRIILALLLLALVLWLLSKCNRCSRQITPVTPPVTDRPWIGDDPNVGVGDGGIYDPGNPYNPVPTPDNPDYEGVLPPNQGVLPPVDSEPVIIPGNPTILGDRLNILMENEDKSIMDLAVAFKEKYPDDKYEVIYYDNVVKRMQIKVPQEERTHLKEIIPSQFAPEYELYVFDEALFESVYQPNDPAINDSDKSWYLNAINAFEAWSITMGSPDITIAVVDNGFNLKHPEFKDKVVMPYNVWRHSDEISAHNDDHGTHTAGTALASADNGIGLCGIAPNCKFMPVQVADDNEFMTTTSILDGILYAMYQGADVINVSLGGMFEGLDGYSEDVQRDIQDNHFKEEERLWNEVEKIAEKHNVTIVTAAGNDNVLAGVDAMNRPNNIIKVSAIDKSKTSITKTDFSNYGEYSTVSAPGVSIFSSYGKDGYAVLNGTSMAAPIVSGCVALMKSLNDTITNEQIICVLQGTGVQSEGNVGNLIQIDKALEKVKSGELNDCLPRPTKPSTGDVQILLSWNGYNDLDLYCVDPNNDVLWYKNLTVPSGGKLEIDMNAQYPDSRTPIENIYWPTNGAPNGKYAVFVKYYKVHEATSSGIDYHVKVLHEGIEENFDGTATTVDIFYPVCTFIVGEENDGGQLNETPEDDETMEKIKRLLIKRDSLQRKIDEINDELKEINK